MTTQTQLECERISISYQQEMLVLCIALPKIVGLYLPFQSDRIDPQ